MRVIQLCVGPSPHPSKARVSREQLWVYFQIKMPSAGPNLSRQVPSISGRRLARSHGTQQHRLSKRIQLPPLLFFLSLPLAFPPCLSLISLHLYEHKHKHTTNIYYLYSSCPPECFWYWIFAHEKAYLEEPFHSSKSITVNPLLLQREAMIIVLRRLFWGTFFFFCSYRIFSSTRGTCNVYSLGWVGCSTVNRHLIKPLC